MKAEPKTMPSLVPPFTKETAILKIRVIEDNWNSRNPEQLARGYSEPSRTKRSRPLRENIDDLV